MTYDQIDQWGNTMAANLREFVDQMRAGLDRGLPITARTLLEGLEIALENHTPRHGPIPYQIGITHIEDKARRLRAMTVAQSQPDLFWRELEKRT